jgi:hypothetical protein
MKFAIVLFSLVAVAFAAPQPIVPLDSATANVGVIGKVQTAGNVVGDVVTVGVNAQLGIKADVDQDIVNVILGLINNQNGNDVSVAVPPKNPEAPEPQSEKPKPKPDISDLIEKLKESLKHKN